MENHGAARFLHRGQIVRLRANEMGKRGPRARRHRLHSTKNEEQARGGADSSGATGASGKLGFNRPGTNFSLTVACWTTDQRQGRPKRTVSPTHGERGNRRGDGPRARG